MSEIGGEGVKKQTKVSEIQIETLGSLNFSKTSEILINEFYPEGGGTFLNESEIQKSPNYLIGRVGQA